MRAVIAEASAFSGAMLSIVPAMAAWAVIRSSRKLLAVRIPAYNLV
jgi:hypothetical protein